MSSLILIGGPPESASDGDSRVFRPVEIDRLPAERRRRRCLAGGVTRTERSAPVILTLLKIPG
jgi:hypothetical protein